jgi:hypothetical protein
MSEQPDPAALALESLTLAAKLEAAETEAAAYKLLLLRLWTALSRQYRGGQSLVATRLEDSELARDLRDAVAE